MKKGIVLTLAVAGFFAFTTIGCGEKYTPLTDEQIATQAEEQFAAIKDQKATEFEAACNADLEAKAAAKFEEMKTAAVAAK